MKRQRLQTIHSLAEALPRLVSTAEEYSRNFLTGRHRSGRSGVGEVFREFRRYEPGDPLNWIDWRRSARDDRVTLRLREKMSPRQVWLWVDPAASMKVAYQEGELSKYEAGLVLALVIADVVCRSGDRVGLLGLNGPVCRRDIIPFAAERLLSAEDYDFHSDRVGKGDEIYLFSDGYRWVEESLDALQSSFGRAKGRFVEITNTIEATFPFESSIDFIDPVSGVPLRTHSAEGWRAIYLERRTKLEKEREVFCRKHQWPMLSHRAEADFGPTVNALHALLETGGHAASQSAWVA